MYFGQLYAEIVHNQPLTTAARPIHYTEQSGLTVNLLLGNGADELLLFSPYLRYLGGEIDELTGLINQSTVFCLAALRSKQGFLHRSQTEKIKTRILNNQLMITCQMDDILAPSTEVGDGALVSNTLDRLSAIQQNVNFAQESQGVLPLSEIAEEMPKVSAAKDILTRHIGSDFKYLGSSLQQMGLSVWDYHWPAADKTTIQRASLDLYNYSDLQDRRLIDNSPLLLEIENNVNEEAKSAPRVLNANFVNVQGAALGPEQPMLAGQEYSLMVDVGPRWDKTVSIVTGNGAFPEQALPPDDNGHLIKVVFISSDFTTVDSDTTKTDYNDEYETEDDDTTPEREDSKFEIVDIKPFTDEDTGFATEEFRSALISRWIWVPRQTGRSRPVINGEILRDAGPVLLQMRAPEFSDGIAREIIIARGRLCL